MKLETELEINHMRELGATVNRAMVMERALHRFTQELKNTGHPVVFNDMRNLISAINSTGDATDVLATLYNIVEEEMKK